MKKKFFSYLLLSTFPATLALTTASCTKTETKLVKAKITDVKFLLEELATTSFYEKDKLSLSAGRLEISYDDGTITNDTSLDNVDVELVSSPTGQNHGKVTLGEYVFESIGTYSFDLTYKNDYKATFYVQVKELLVTQILIAQAPLVSNDARLKYQTTRNGEQVEQVSDFVSLGSKALKAKSKSELQRTPITSVFQIESNNGEEFLLDAFLDVTYNSGKSENIKITPSMIQQLEVDLSTPGVKTFDITFESKTDTFSFDVYEEVNDTSATQIVTNIQELPDVSSTSTAAEIQAFNEIAQSNYAELKTQMDQAIRNANALLATDPKAKPVVLVPYSAYNVSQTTREGSLLKQDGETIQEYESRITLILDQKGVSIIGSTTNAPIFYSVKELTQPGALVNQSTITVKADDVTLKNIVIKNKKRNSQTPEGEVTVVKSLEIAADNVTVTGCIIDGSDPGNDPLVENKDPNRDIGTAIYIGNFDLNDVTGAAFKIRKMLFTNNIIKDGYINIGNGLTTNPIYDLSQPAYSGSAALQNYTFAFTKNTFINSAFSFKGKDVNRGWLLSDLVNLPTIVNNTFESPFFGRDDFAGISLAENGNKPYYMRLTSNRYDANGEIRFTEDFSSIKNSQTPNYYPNGVTFFGYMQSFANANIFKTKLTENTISGVFGTMSNTNDPRYSKDTIVNWKLKDGQTTLPNQLVGGEVLTNLYTASINYEFKGKTVAVNYSLLTNLDWEKATVDQSGNSGTVKLKNYTSNFYFA